MENREIDKHEEENLRTDGGNMAQLDHNTTTAKHPRKAVSDVHLFFSKRTPNFSSRLDVLIFSAISASDVLNDVLNYYSYGITVYLILNTTILSL